ncbi:MAG TPA: alpha/beta hydrolase [Gemmatimonadaceae bacterium]|jgi:pimeloyl-ACP methyl ester carboxylesterase
MFPAGAPDISTRMLRLSTGVQLRVAESGPADGVPLVMLHGWGASLYMFRHGFERLPSLGVRAIAVDLRGYGLSDHPWQRGSYSLAAYSSDLMALLDALELERPALLAQSMAGGLSLHFALAHPDRVRGLALVNPSSLVTIPWTNAMRIIPRVAMNVAGERLIPRRLVALILRRMAYGDASKVSTRDIDEYWAPTQIPGFARALRGAIAEFDWRPLTTSEAASLAVPSVVILGLQDHVIRSARGAAERLNGAQVFSLPGGHCVHEEDPDTVYPLIADFLDRVR